MPPRSPAGRANVGQGTAGQPAGRSRRITTPARQQDGTDFGLTLEQTVFVNQVSPVEVRVETLEQVLAGASVVRTRTATLTLPPGRRGGSLELQDRYADGEVDAPVLMVQAPPERQDEAEGGIILFVARVVSPTRLRVTWWAPFPVPAQVKVHYIISSAEE